MTFRHRLVKNLQFLSRILSCVLIVSSCANAVVRARSATFRTSDGVSLHYFDAGTGPAIVLIPGWTMSADIFEPQINELSTQFRVIALDPRSQGDSEKAADGNTLERHAQDIQDLLDHLELHSVVLLGWSNGVPDVLTYVEQKGTAKLRGLVLVDGFLKLSDPEMQKAMTGILQMFQADRPKFTDRFVRSMYNSKQTEEYILHFKEESLKTPTNTAVVEVFNILSRGDFTPTLAKMDKPVLYMCEPRLESQGTLLQASLPKARVEVFKNAGHAMFVDDAEHFNKVLAEFVDSLAAVPDKDHQ
jgi:non-heme chloroperoxidase